MGCNLTETWDLPPYSEQNFEISLYDKTKNFPTASLAIYLRIRFERALLMNQRVIVIGLEELFPREDVDNEEASMEFVKWLSEEKHQIEAFCRNITAVSPAFIAYFTKINHIPRPPKSKGSSALDASAMQNLKGQEHIKDTLQAIIEIMRDPQKQPKCRGALLYGPPGTGKTCIAHAICCSYPLHFETLRVPDFLHAEVGTSELSLHEAFSRAIKHQPAVIFIDEMEAVFKGRQASPLGSVENRLASQIILEFDRIANSRVFVLGVTNLIEHLDSALFTSGRFDAKIFVGLPSSEARKNIISALLKDASTLPMTLLNEAVEKTEGYSPAKLSALVDNARRIRLHKEIQNDDTAQLSLLEIILKDCL